MEIILQGLFYIQDLKEKEMKLYIESEIYGTGNNACKERGRMDESKSYGWGCDCKKRVKLLEKGIMNESENFMRRGML